MQILTPSIQSLSATICHVMGIKLPLDLLEAPLEQVLAEHQRQLGSAQIRKCLVYAPDAMGRHLYHHDRELMDSFELAAPIRVELRAVMPSVTPVCFASMFTGLAPALHGIQTYSKPVLSCQTLFDYLVQAGKRVAIVAVAESSIDLIFRQRPIGYFSEADDAAVTDRALELLKADQHDFLLVYHQDYDDALHESGPFSERALAAARRHAEASHILAEGLHQHWPSHDRMLVIAPDHGAHEMPDGSGDHGLEIPEDMDVDHYYGLFPARA